MGSTNNAKTPSYQRLNLSNPYARAYIDNFGSGYTLNPFLTAQNKTIEQTVPKLYEHLINPDLNDTVSLARRQAFNKAFNSESQKSFENNLINPLSKRNMLRSSLLNDLSNNLTQTRTSQIADFNNGLLTNSISDTQSLINFYMNQYANNAKLGQSTLSGNTNSMTTNSYNTSNSIMTNENIAKLIGLALSIGMKFI